MELGYDPLKRFGRHLAALRRSQGVSQERLALESGLARSYMSGVERGVRNVSIMNICIIAKALGCPPARLLEFSDAPETEPET
ncbi:helix-turn-helix domain-containing protein [Thauera sp. ZXT1-4]|uniref:helix-turn-helix domain-containing protein n=1 Tax=Thauera sp. ZXT1-4 TaxID=3460294 RepID=UPI0040408D74